MLRFNVLGVQAMLEVASSTSGFTLCIDTASFFKCNDVHSFLLPYAAMFHFPGKILPDVSSSRCVFHPPSKCVKLKRGGGGGGGGGVIYGVHLMHWQCCMLYLSANDQYILQVP